MAIRTCLLWWHPTLAEITTCVVFSQEDDKNGQDNVTEAKETPVVMTEMTRMTRRLIVTRRRIMLWRQKHCKVGQATRAGCGGGRNSCVVCNSPILCKCANTHVYCIHTHLHSHTCTKLINAKYTQRRVQIPEETKALHHCVFVFCIV